MKVTREQVEQRIEELASEHQDASDLVHALSGAIQDCQYWLERMDALETMEEDDEGHNELVSPIPEEGQNA